MDELEISGKRYISSKRAGKEHNYHPDYIGQLIRANKIPGQKVGRSWYVDADALTTYLYSKEGLGVSDAGLPKLNDVKTDILAFRNAEESKRFTAILKEPIWQKEEGVRKVSLTIEPSLKEERSFFTEHTDSQTRRGLTYIADDRPLLPIIEKRNQGFQARAVSIPEVSVQRFKGRKPKKRYFLILLSILFSIVCTGGFALLFSVLVNSLYTDTYQNVSSSQISIDTSYLASFMQTVKFN